jgi:hypothetical protein
MPYFLVRLSGEGIDLALEDSPKPAIGFFTTRLVRTTDSREASNMVIRLVLEEWRPEGQYASCNRGELPRLSVEDAWQVGWLRGTFGPSSKGYSFFLRND